MKSSGDPPIVGFGQPVTRRSISRREWMKVWMRRSLAFMIGMISLLFVRRRLATDCVRPNTTCRLCLEVNRCSLPAAIKQRQSEREETHDV